MDDVMMVPIAEYERLERAVERLQRERDEATAALTELAPSSLLARAERAEAAIQRVRELANRWSFLEDEDVTVDELRDQVLAALDSTDPAGGTE